MIVTRILQLGLFQSLVFGAKIFDRGNHHFEATSSSLQLQYHTNSANAFHSSSVWSCFVLSILLVICGATWYLFRSTEGKDTSFTQSPHGTLRVESQHGEPIPAALEEGGVLPMFNAQVLSNPDKPALIQAGTGFTLSYGELALKMDKLAVAFSRANLGAGDVVGLLFEPCISYVVTTLAVLKVKSAWAPLDVKSPGERLAQQCRDAGARLVCLSNTNKVNHIVGLPLWRLDEEGTLIDNNAGVLPEHTLRDPRAAVMFYTSGSTGKSKAVVYGPETLCHGALTLNHLLKPDSSTVWLMKTPPVWVVTEWELFCPLVSGGCTIVDASSQWNVMQLVDTVRRYNISVVASTAPIMQLLLDESLPSLQHLVNCGAPISMGTCNSLHTAFCAQGLKVHNVYGCTESPCVQWTYTKDFKVFPRCTDSGQIVGAPAGRPQPGADVAVVDKDDTPVAVGVVGEILIGGRFLPHGYFGDEKLTKQRFVQVPGVGHMYRTGDAGFWIQSSDGLLLMVEGRLDRQLNINGIRVAPEEIETVISQALGVTEVCLAVVGQEGEHCLVACVSGTSDNLPDVVRNQCSKFLPTHMRPSLVVQLETLPKLPNGKRDLLRLTSVADAAWKAEIATQEATIDSLGRLRMVKRSLVKELQIMSALRASATIGLIIFHWYFGAIVGFGEEATVRAVSMPGNPLWKLSLGFFYCLDWATLLFLCMSGYADSKRPPQGLFKLNVSLMIVYIAMAWPIPHLTSFFQHEILQNSFAAWSGKHRWYLKYYVLCNLLHSICFGPLQELLSRASIRTQRLIPLCIVLSIGIVTFSVAYLYQQTPEGFKVCRRPPGSLKNLSELPAVQNPFDNWLYVVTDECEIIVWAYLPHLLVYSMCWWYGPMLVDFLRNHSALSNFNLSGPAFCFAMLLAISRLDAWIIASGGQVYGFWQYSLSLMVIGCMVGIVTMLADCFWFPLKFLSWLGNYSLSTYLFHLTFTSVKDDRPHMTFFAYRDNVLIPPPEAVLQHIHGPPILMAMLNVIVNFAYAIVWIATFGVLLQHCSVGLARLFDLLIGMMQDVCQMSVNNSLK